MLSKVYAKTVLNKHKKRDEWFLDDYSFNPYYGFSFGCIYCYLRGTKYGRRSERLLVKINAPRILARELSRYARRGEYGFIAISSATEPWMTGIEDKYKVTRRSLEVINRYKFPVHCLTKSTLIIRDLDILEEIDQYAVLPSDLRKIVGHGVLISFSFSTLDDNTARIFEPGAPLPRDRLETLKKIKDIGFMAGIAYMPILPYITDTELEEMAKTAKDIGADYVFFAPLTLQGKGKELFLNLIGRRFPDLLDKYHELYRYGFTPIKQYTTRFYKQINELVNRHGLKLGITRINLPI